MDSSLFLGHLESCASCLLIISDDYFVDEKARNAEIMIIDQIFEFCAIVRRCLEHVSFEVPDHAFVRMGAFRNPREKRS